MATTQISKALWKATKTLYKEEERRRKDAARQQKADRDRQRRAIRETSLVEAVFAVMEEAVEKATCNGSLPTSVRNLYYQVRPLIQRYTGKELRYEYFSQDLLPRYQEEHGPITGLYYDPRGVLYEPHTGRAVPLGTREVEEYRFPAWLFDKILYVEKKGLWPVLRTARIAERHDMAVVAAEGYANEAARVLFGNAEQDRDYQLFVLHDADPHGYNIARTLREATRRMPGHSVDVVDLGLKLDEALAMGLQTEEFTRKKELPERLLPRLTEIERAYFEGERTGRKSWICERVELNAMTSLQLIEYIERRLKENGVRGKVIQPGDELPDLTKGLYEQTISAWVDYALDDLMSGIKRQLADEFANSLGLEHARQWIVEGLEKDDARSWSGALGSKLQALLYEEHTDALNDALQRRITEAVRRDG